MLASGFQKVLSGNEVVLFGIEAESSVSTLLLTRILLLCICDRNLYSTDLPTPQAYSSFARTDFLDCFTPAATTRLRAQGPTSIAYTEAFVIHILQSLSHIVPSTKGPPTMSVDHNGTRTRSSPQCPANLRLDSCPQCRDSPR